MNMKKNLGYALATLALAVSGSANAALINWGTVTAPHTQNFQYTFDDLGSFTNEYRFTLSGAADSFGGVFEIDTTGWRGVDLDKVSLKKGATLLGVDYSPGVFSFSNLTSGTYSFFVEGETFFDLDNPFDFGDVGYKGSITFGTSTPPPTSVAEPGTLLLMGFGLIGLAFATRRRMMN